MSSQNEKGWSPSDYAYSIDVLTCLQETVRAAFEASKRERLKKAKKARTEGEDYFGIEPLALTL